MALLMNIMLPSSSLGAALAPPPLRSQCSWKTTVRGGGIGNFLISSVPNNSSWSVSTTRLRGFNVKAFFPNPTEEPILKEALKEPVAFVGGIFAGLLRLDLKEEPLKEWVARTVEASGISAEEINKRDDDDEHGEEGVPQQIEIE